VGLLALDCGSEDVKLTCVSCLSCRKIFVGGLNYSTDDGE
jgi:hypothetical protein